MRPAFAGARPAAEVVIGPDETAPIGMCFMPVPETKTIKNRVHLDLTTGAADRDAGLSIDLLSTDEDCG